MTTPNGIAVACIAAPSHDHAKPDSPWRSLHGEKWSDDHARSKPAASASRIAASSALGAICSCEAWMPIEGTPPLRTPAARRLARRPPRGAARAPPRPRTAAGARRAIPNATAAGKLLARDQVAPALERAP